jgi:FMN phosphatase YigB (HAD superfamily)
MRLGFDLDGTVADLQGALALEARRLFPGVDPGTLPRSIAPQADGAPAGEVAPAFSMSALSQRQQRELWEAACARVNFWESLKEIEPGSLARLSRLARERRWDVIFLTSRPETRGDTAQVQSHRWLAAQGFEMPSVFVVHGSRGKIASSLQLDVLVDDRPENCLDIAIDSGARAILVWRGGEDTVPGSARQLGIGSVTSIADCLGILESLDRADQDVSLVDRFKQLLGLKRPPRRMQAKPPVDSRAAAAG